MSESAALHCKCQYRKERRDVVLRKKGDAELDVFRAIAREFRIPHASLKIVVKGRVIPPEEVTKFWKEDPSCVFFVVGNPLSNDDIARAKAARQKKLAEIERKKAKEAKALELKEKARRWEEEETARVEQLRADTERRRAERKSRQGVCGRFSEQALLLPSAIGQAPGVRHLLAVVQGVSFFLRGLVSPTPMTEVEHARLREEERDRWNGNRGRGVHGLEHRERTKLTTPMGG